MASLSIVGTEPSFEMVFARVGPVQMQGAAWVQTSRLTN